MAENRLSVKKIKGIEELVEEKLRSVIVNDLETVSETKVITAKQGNFLKNTKLNKVMGSKANNVPVFGSDGHLIDSGKPLRIIETFNGFIDSPVDLALPLTLSFPVDVRLENFTFKCAEGGLKVELLSEGESIFDSEVTTEKVSTNKFKNPSIQKGSDLYLKLEVDFNIDTEGFAYTLSYSRSLS